MSKKANKKDKPNRPMTAEMHARGCKSCGRWASFAKAIYQDSGELCDADSCPNLVEDVEIDFYAESDALNEKSAA